jgi:hypothetical protein
MCIDLFAAGLAIRITVDRTPPSQFIEINTVGSMRWISNRCVVYPEQSGGRRWEPYAVRGNDRDSLGIVCGVDDDQIQQQS